MYIWSRWAAVKGRPGRAPRWQEGQSHPWPFRGLIVLSSGFRVHQSGNACFSHQLLLLTINSQPPSHKDTSDGSKDPVGSPRIPPRHPKS